MGPVVSSPLPTTDVEPDASAPDGIGPVRRQADDRAVPPSAAGRTWVAVVPAIVALVAILVFILQNLHEANVRFVSLSGSAPLGLALLAAAVLGGLVVFCLGSVRILQLRRLARRRYRRTSAEPPRRG